MSTNILVLLISIGLLVVVNTVFVWDLYKEKAKLQKLQNRVYKKAAQILGNAQEYATSTIASYQARLKKLTQQNTKVLEEESKSLQSHYKKMVGDIDDEYREKASSAVSLLEKATEGEVKEFGEEIDKEIAAQLKKSKQEIEEYKKEKLANIDEAVVKVVKSASEEILGKAISLRDHQALITEALEKAKKEHFV